MAASNKRVIINSLKIITAAVVSIFIAWELNLDFSMSAGIVAILTIRPTKTETVKLALTRLCAFGISLMVAFTTFKIFGFTMIAYFVYLAIYVSVCQIFQWRSSMTINPVLISHFVTLEVMDVASVVNEALIFLIGVGCGILVNLHLKKNVHYFESVRKETDDLIVDILARMSKRVLCHDMPDYYGDSFVTLKQQIRHAKNIAEENYHNTFRNKDTFDMEYISMRDSQCQILYEMHKEIRKMDMTPHTAEVISNFLMKMAEEFEEDNGHLMMSQFREMDLYMKSQPLPVMRQEFENRARLFGLMRSIEEFIEIKIEFSERFS